MWDTIYTLNMRCITAHTCISDTDTHLSETNTHIFMYINVWNERSAPEKSDRKIQMRLWC